MLGGLLSLLAAATFAWSIATARRGVITGSAAQAMTLSIPIGLPVFLAALVASSNLGALWTLSGRAWLLFGIVGITHFIIGRYCNYRALKAIGNNLAGPVLQTGLLLSLALAIVLLGEKLTPLRILGIVLVMAGPFLARERSRPAEGFKPKYAEGYTYAVLCAVAFSFSPVLVRMALDHNDVAASLAGGLVASLSSSAVIALLLFWPGHWRDLRAVKTDELGWFTVSGILVYVSQAMTYMALALAPVTVVAPIVASAQIFRMFFSYWMNPSHEVFGSRIILGTIVSFVGVVAISISTDALPLPDALAGFFHWQWP